MIDKAPPSDARDPRDVLTSELGYSWDPPPKPRPPAYGAFWQEPAVDPVQDMAEELVAVEWRVADLRQSIEVLGEQPRGRTRRDLAQQLAEAFLDRERLAQRIAELSESDRDFYTYLLLEANLQAIYAMPAPAGLARVPGRTYKKDLQRIVEQGLAMKAPDQQVFFPFGTMQRLPPLYIPLPTITEPEKYIPAGDGRNLVAQVQQILGLLQSVTSALRARPRWEAPPYPYAQQTTVAWPPVPSDARKITEDPHRQMTLTLWPPEPDLDTRSLAAWCEALGAEPSWVEFLYHIMTSSGVLWSGSPVTVDHDLVQSWMTLPPGRQLAAIYSLYRNITSWATWWSLWREGRVEVRRFYQGYWSLISLDDAVHTTTSSLRWVLLETLAFVPHDTWIDFADLIAWFTQLFPNTDTQGYLMGMQLHVDQGGWRGWQAFLEMALKSLLTGPLYALGFVDIAPSLDRVEAIRLKRLQGLHWSRTNEVAMVVTGSMSEEGIRYLSDQATLEVATPVPPDLVNCILQWAKPSGFSQNLVRYDLEVSRLHRTFESGDDPQSLQRAWVACVGFEPPTEIVTWWQTWWDRYGHVRLYSDQALLQTRDAFTMHEVQVSLPRLQESIRAMVTPDAALIEDEDVDKILEDLQRQGYMPKESS